MMKTLYFAKINLNTEELFKVYNGDNLLLENKNNNLALSIKQGLKYTKVNEFKNNGEIIKTEEKFEFGSIERTTIDGELLIVGDLIKTSKLYAGKFNKDTKIKEVRPIDNDEIIRFVFYPKYEMVSYSCTRRFGYKVFVEAFEELINKISEVDKYVVTIQTNGVSLDNLKKDLKKINNIKQLSIETVVPNPTPKLEKEILKGKERLKNYEEGRITRKKIILESNSEQGVELNSKEISDELSEINNIHSALGLEDATAKGYVIVIATSKSGQVYNTNNEDVIKHKIKSIDSMYELAGEVKKIIEKVFK